MRAQTITFELSDGEQVAVIVTNVKDYQALLGIDAPLGVEIVREELPNHLAMVIVDQGVDQLKNG